MSLATTKHRRRKFGPHTVVVGAAFDRDVFNPTDVPQFAYTFTRPGVFAQDDFDVTRWLSLSGSARIDHQSAYGTFVSPRVSALVRDFNPLLRPHAVLMGGGPLTNGHRSTVATSTPVCACSSDEPSVQPDGAVLTSFRRY